MRKHSCSANRIPLLHPSIHRYFIGDVGIRCVERDGLEVQISVRNENIRSPRGGVFITHHHRGTQRVVVVDVLIVARYLRNKDRPIAKTRVLVGDPEVAVIPPTGTPAVFDEPGSVIPRDSSTGSLNGKKLLTEIIIPSDEQHLMVGIRRPGVVVGVRLAVKIGIVFMIRHAHTAVCGHQFLKNILRHFVVSQPENKNILHVELIRISEGRQSGAGSIGGITLRGRPRPTSKKGGGHKVIPAILKRIGGVAFKTHCIFKRKPPQMHFREVLNASPLDKILRFHGAQCGKGPADTVESLISNCSYPV